MVRDLILLFCQILKRPTWFKRTIESETGWTDILGRSSPAWWLYVGMCISISTLIFCIGKVQGLPTAAWFIVHEIIKDSIGENLSDIIGKFLVAPTEVILVLMFGLCTVFVHMFMRMTNKYGNFRCFFQLTVANTVTWCVIQSLAIIPGIIALGFGTPKESLNSVYMPCLALWYMVVGYITVFYLFRLIQLVYHVSPIHAFISIGGILPIILFAGISFLPMLGFAFICWILVVPIGILVFLSPFFTRVLTQSEVKSELLLDRLRDIPFFIWVALFFFYLIWCSCACLVFHIKRDVDERRIAAFRIFLHIPFRQRLLIIILAAFLTWLGWFVILLHPPKPPMFH